MKRTFTKNPFASKVPNVQERSEVLPSLLKKDSKDNTSSSTTSSTKSSTTSSSSSLDCNTSDHGSRESPPAQSQKPSEAHDLLVVDSLYDIHKALQVYDAPRQQKLPSLYVFGKTGSGKTSLLNSLQCGKKIVDEEDIDDLSSSRSLIRGKSYFVIDSLDTYDATYREKLRKFSMSNTCILAGNEPVEWKHVKTFKMPAYTKPESLAILEKKFPTVSKSFLKSSLETTEYSLYAAILNVTHGWTSFDGMDVTSNVKQTVGKLFEHKHVPYTGDAEFLVSMCFEHSTESMRSFAQQDHFSVLDLLSRHNDEETFMLLRLCTLVRKQQALNFIKFPKANPKRKSVEQSELEQVKKILELQ